tara:strand:+ start:299 stop:985 length:687 start_codon:yes stop_codon:yes gene_type:complete
MSLPVFQATVVNGTGDLLPAATVTVLVEATGQPAVLYSDRNGTVPLGTLGVFSLNAGAFAQFFAAPDNYRVTANDSGSGFSRTWDYVPLVGTAAFVDTGLLTGNVPTADELSMVGQTVNYTGGNLNPNVFGVSAGNDFIAFGHSASANTAWFLLPASQIPASIGFAGTFTVGDYAGNAVSGGSGITPTLSGLSSDKGALIQFTGLSISPPAILILKADSPASLITVNP